ncbi:MAG: isocitrate/isopropylmalate family dehydrogenase, partial [Gemmatimonadales bacterium]|nr:isocitrate/isopropylmalate family dehydrogenase [Gemmatimonadales bacterium]
EQEAALGSGKLLIKDVIADIVFQQTITRARDFDVLATTNLNGDYLSDACAAQVGGLGIAPGANIGDGFAMFEATHGTAPKYADLDKINPGGVIMSGVMMFEHLGWEDVAHTIVHGFEGAIRSRHVTYDLARQTEGATEVSTSAFADQIVECMG